MPDINNNDMRSPSQREPATTSQGIFKIDGGKTTSNAIAIPSIALPKGGGAIKGIDEKFAVNAINGTSTFSIPLPFSPARGASPALSLSYNSGAGNGLFGLGWNATLPSIRRKTDQELPQYMDAIDSDTYLFSGAEDLVPEFEKIKHPDGTAEFKLDTDGNYIIYEIDSPDGACTIRFYKPRMEGLFTRIERWTNKATGIIKWRLISKDNYTILFGWTNNAVIADPADSSGTRIFEWFAEFEFDDKGNCCAYTYKKEDQTGFNVSSSHNKNRIANGAVTYANLYPEKVLYGNKTPYKKFGDVFPAATDYLFQTVFDYGEYNPNPPYTKIKEWDYRTDAFSDHRPGFEIRTTRLCKRVLLFHFFNELPGGVALVRSLNMEYDTMMQQGFTFLRSVTAVGYIKKNDGTYTSKKLPALEYTYRQPEWNKEVKSITTENRVHAPAGLDEQQYQFTDLYNEGLSGILTEQADGWYYKHNLGDGKFEQAKLVSPKPSFHGLNDHLHLADLDADGGRQLVSYNKHLNGFFELNDDNEWQRFRDFKNFPNIDLNDPAIRMIDLDGDGRAEILITEDNVFKWYRSEGRDGFSPAIKTTNPFDEEAGPQLVFSDAAQTIFLADMSGDGMTDLVRIRNGELCYWPNLGYGQFGAKIAMDNAPVFDFPDAFNPAYLRLADIDGSGTTDIIYLGKNKFSCWMNVCGNAFSPAPYEITAFPEIHSHSHITVTDLLGNGVACIVWSGGLSKDSTAPLRYIDLMSSRKPWLLIAYKNNLGKEVKLQYTSSTAFYLQDKRAGQPWITKLHFPVHCVSGIETIDRISGWRFSKTYKYHHGYYDHAEREFRGFGMVEQTDTEHFDHWKKADATNITDATLHQDPIVAKTWFHTGAMLQREKNLGQFAREYWYEEMKRQGFTVVHHEFELPDAVIIPATNITNIDIDRISSIEWREALRACKSIPLRTEVFAHDAPLIDATPDDLKKQLTPYSVSTHNCIIELLQPKGKNKHAVFIVKESESVTYNYERDINDPRIAHNLNIEVDQFGNVLESAAIVYPRMVADMALPAETQQAQSKTVISYTKNRFTNEYTDAGLFPHVHRLPLPSETTTFELNNVPKAITATYYSTNDLKDILTDAKSSEAEYFELNKPPVPGKAQRRLIEHIRTTYYRNDLTGALPLHHLESLALAHESYQLAFTPALLNDIYGARVNAALMIAGKYTNSEEDNNWWIRSGTMQFIQGAETATDAQNRFYVPVSYTDPHLSVSHLKYYSNYFLFIEETEDAFKNTTHVDLFNFHTLAPQRVRDINNNISEVISDELGIIKAFAVFGKGNEADDLTGLTPFTDTAETALINNFFTTPLTAAGVTDSVALTITGNQLLQHATARYVFDLDVYKNTGKPVVIATILRDEHFAKNNNSPLKLSFEYSNGLGKIVMKKIQAEPGFAKIATIQPDNTYTIAEVDTASLAPKQLRWIGNGREVLNNKGKTVKQYEPYFSATHQYEDLKELVETGVTPVMRYDAAGRLIKTRLPDDTFSKVEFSAWKQSVHDANDTILESPWYTNRFNRLIDAALLAEGKDPAREKEAAEKGAKHANTPTVMHYNSLGKPVLSVEHNKNTITAGDEFYRTKAIIDIEGNLRSILDARELPENGNSGNTLMQYKYDMLGNLAWHKSMDAGQRWQLPDVTGKNFRTWDERDHEIRYFYDVLHRPTHSQVMGGDGAVPLDNIYSRTIYGESLLLPNRTNAAALQAMNLLGKAIKSFDTGSMSEIPGYDFKGQPASITRRLYSNYKSVPNWTDANLTSDLEAATYTFVVETDALGRVTRKTTPDLSVLTPSYNETGLLNGQTVTHVNPALTTDYIKNIYYNEKGQRKKIVYGNNVSTQFTYDKATFRLIQLESKRQNNDPLQRWHYTFDAIGNITHIEDRNIPLVFFDNQKITGVSTYTYDALYRLVEATGRENNAALAFGTTDNYNDAPYSRQHNPGDAMAMRNYTQSYGYDEVGNIKQMKHVAGGLNNWTRDYSYEKTTNRLQTTQVGGETYNYTHHPQHGFITVLPHLEEMGWNFKEELIKSIRQKRNDGGTAETTYYQYDGQGQRIRKITENTAAPGAIATKKDERIYFGGFETFRKYQANTVSFERESLNLMDEAHCFVLIETIKQNTDPVPDPSETIGTRLVRYQLHNHLGSSALELDGTPQATVISYEEYHPFGTTAYQAGNATIKAAAKRYRYTGMERDEETGLEYHSARYYLPWLGRWLNADPISISDGPNVYAFVGNNPINLTDKKGTERQREDGPCLLPRTLDPKKEAELIKAAKKNKDYAAMARFAKNKSESDIKAKILSGLDSTGIAQLHIEAMKDPDNSVLAGLTEKIPVRGFKGYQNGYYTKDGTAIDPAKVTGLDPNKQDYNQVFIVKEDDNNKGSFIIDHQLGIGHFQMLKRAGWAFHEGAITPTESKYYAAVMQNMSFNTSEEGMYSNATHQLEDGTMVNLENELKITGFNHQTAKPDTLKLNTIPRAAVILSAIFVSVDQGGGNVEGGINQWRGTEPIYNKFVKNRQPGASLITLVKNEDDSLWHIFFKSDFSGATTSMDRDIIEIKKGAITTKSITIK